MIELRPAAEAETATWQADWETRQWSFHRAQGLADHDIETTMRRRAEWRATEQPMTVSTIVAGTDQVGFVAVSEREAGTEGGRGIVQDIWIAPERRRRGYGRAALVAVEDRCRRGGLDRVVVTLDPNDPGQAALFASYRITSQRMALALADPPPLPDGVVGRPMSESEFAAWRAENVDGYAQDISGSGAMSYADALARSEREFAELLPDGLRTSDQSLWVVEVAGRQVASIWICHHRQIGRSFVYSVATVASERGKGYGRAAMHVGARLALAAGDQVLELNVFGQNAVAINLYTSLGYRVTDQSRDLDLGSAHPARGSSAG